MIIGYRLRDKSGNYPEQFTEKEMFEHRRDADSWRTVNDGDWDIIPVTQEEMKNQAIYFSCLEDDDIDWDKEWNQFMDEQLEDE